mmetsp:Transcript_68/g.191  ORF Transcript_68/g.191 Transcript_68/m.191 type:complete len:515 (+) Transcript_68:101-1645(+)
MSLGVRSPAQVPVTKLASPRREPSEGPTGQIGSAMEAVQKEVATHFASNAERMNRVEGRVQDLSNLLAELSSAVSMEAFSPSSPSFGGTRGRGNDLVDKENPKAVQDWAVRFVKGEVARLEEVISNHKDKMHSEARASVLDMQRSMQGDLEAAHAALRAELQTSYATIEQISQLRAETRNMVRIEGDRCRSDFHLAFMRQLCGNGNGNAAHSPTLVPQDLGKETMLSKSPPSNGDELLLQTRPNWRSDALQDLSAEVTALRDDLDARLRAAGVQAASLHRQMEAQVSTVSEYCQSAVKAVRSDLSTKLTDVSDVHSGLNALRVDIRSLAMQVAEAKAAAASDRPARGLDRGSQQEMSSMARTFLDVESQVQSLESQLNEALDPLVAAVLKIAQLIGLVGEESVEARPWREQCTELPRQLSHAWLRLRLPRKETLLKLVRQKADAQQVLDLHNEVENFGRELARIEGQSRKQGSSCEKASLASAPVLPTQGRPPVRPWSATLRRGSYSARAVWDG